MSKIYEIRLDDAVKRLLLTIFAPRTKGKTGFCASAVVVERRRGDWYCERIAPILYWLKYKPVRGWVFFLKGPAKKNGWTYEWRHLTPRPGEPEELDQHSGCKRNYGL